MATRHKHAFLILAHNNWYNLERLLKLLDSPDNDIYIHIDKKVVDFDFDYFRNLCKSSNVEYVKRHKVYWGSPDMIHAELELYKAANAKGPYWYYHLISGSDLPLRTKDELYKFYENTQDNFIVAKKNVVAEERLRLYTTHLYKYGFSQWVSRKVHKILKKLQLRLKVDRLKKLQKKYPIIAKGHQWCDLTQPVVSKIVELEGEIKQFSRYTHCVDELYKQMVVLNNPAIAPIADYDNRAIDWTNGGCHPKTYTLTDFEHLCQEGKRDKVFARKFDEKVDKVIIDKIFEHLS